MYINRTEKYQKYFDAYKTLAIDLATLLIRQNKGGFEHIKHTLKHIKYLEKAWDNTVKLETKMAKV